MENAKQFLVQNFLLSIISQNSLLNLEATENSSGRIFTLSLDGDAIAQITSGLFDSAEGMCQGLKDAANGNSSDLQLTIDSHGRLIYTMSFSVGRIKRNESFSINLMEKETQSNSLPIQKQKTVINEGNRWREEQEVKVNYLTENMKRYEKNFQAFQEYSEKRFNRLEEMILRMEQNMSERLTRLEDWEDDSHKAPPRQKPLKMSVGSYPIQKKENGKNINYAPSFEKENAKDISYAPVIENSLAKKNNLINFNPYSLNANYFSFSENNQTIKLLTESGSPVCIEILPQISGKGQYSFKFVNNTKTNVVSFGITTERNGPNWNDNECNYRYSVTNGRIFGKASKKPLREESFGDQHNILEMVVDMDQGALSFFVDDQKVNSCEIDTSELYFVYVSLKTAEDSITVF